jgi:hypothetical protein
MPQAATIKQAKAAYKSRAEQPLTEREKKQLERSVQLDRRAWGLREREKNRLDLAKKRVAQEKAQKDEERRIGTQRRNDKFGFKSSQFHLGAFFRRPNAAPPALLVDSKTDGAGVPSGFLQSAARPKSDVEMGDGGEGCKDANDESQDEYEDVDDESLLEALQSPEVVRFNKVQPKDQARAAISMPPPPRPAFAQSVSKPPAQSHVPKAEDLEWQDFLESSTQIARELSADTPAKHVPPAHMPAAKETLRTGSFSSGSFEFTEDDIEQLDPTPRGRIKHDQTSEQTKVASERMETPPPPIPLEQRAQEREKAGSNGRFESASCNEPRHAQDDLGFSLTQLESFVEDDLQLTQVQ